MPILQHFLPMAYGTKPTVLISVNSTQSHLSHFILNGFQVTIIRSKVDMKPCTWYKYKYDSELWQIEFMFVHNSYVIRIMIKRESMLEIFQSSTKGCIELITVYTVPMLQSNEYNLQMLKIKIWLYQYRSSFKVHGLTASINEQELGEWFWDKNRKQSYWMGTYLIHEYNVCITQKMKI